MIIESLTTGLVKGQSTNSTATSFSALVATVTKPEASATRTVIDLGLGPKQRSTLVVYPYGGNDNNDLINVKVSGWSRVHPVSGGQQMWVSSLICTVQATLSSTLVGLAGMPVVATEFFADVLTLTTGIAVLVQGAADVDTAYFKCSTGPFELIEITGDLDTGGDTMNWLYGWE